MRDSGRKDRTSTEAADLDDDEYKNNGSSSSAADSEEEDDVADRRSPQWKRSRVM